MSETERRRVLVCAPDLFFAARIGATARACGVEVAECAASDLAARGTSGEFASALVDLHAPGAVEGVRALRSAAGGRDLPVFGFYSHVDQALRAAAEAAGVTHALPRSAFTARLPALLRGDVPEAG